MKTKPNQTQANTVCRPDYSTAGRFILPPPARPLQPGERRQFPFSAPFDYGIPILNRAGEDRAAFSVAHAYATACTGGLADLSKMPGKGTNLPIEECKIGAAMRDVPGTVCSECYGGKGRFLFPDSIAANRRRFNALDHPHWAASMSFLILHEERSGFFRWNGIGDVQSVAHLARIAWIAERTPEIAHWLPTREIGIVRQYKAEGGTFPNNLCVRLSAMKIDGPAPGFGLSLPRATVRNKTAPAPGEHPCPAPTQGNNCGSCRACWNRSVAVVSYREH